MPAALDHISCDSRNKQNAMHGSMNTRSQPCLLTTLSISADLYSVHDMLTLLYDLLQLINMKQNEGKGYDATKADVWACGVLLFVMLLGMFPFEHT